MKVESKGARNKAEKSSEISGKPPVLLRQMKRFGLTGH